MRPIAVVANEAPPAASRPWTRHYDAGVPASLVYPEVTLTAMLGATADAYPKATATVFFGRRRSYGSLRARVDAFAAGLQGLGLRPGERVALVLPNCPQFLIAFFGTLRAGGVVVPCNPVYTAPEIRSQLADSGARTLVVLSRLYPLAKAARQGTAVRDVIVTNIKEEMPPVLRAAFTLTKERSGGHRAAFRADQGARSFREVLRTRARPTAVATAPSDVAVLQYTGGTTGVPKGAMLSHRALVANALQSRAWFTNLRDGQDAIMAVMPLFHVYGLTVVMNLAVQAAAALILEPEFDVGRVLKDIQRHRPKLFPGAPRIYNAINASPLAESYDLRSIEACISGSAPLHAETARRFRELTGGRLVEGYGLTEAAPVTHCNPIFGEGKQRDGSIGVPFPDVDARIVDTETGTRDCPLGERGELIVRGPQLMDGYHGQPEESAQTIRGGWLYTGDIATVDADGYFSIVDRKKELIIVSGFNVYPREVEERLAEHPAVLESAAIGVPHALRGEEVKAFVALHAGRTATADELMAFCREALAPFKVPRAIEFRDSLPKTIVGKVLRRTLADEDRVVRDRLDAGTR
ncbi:MAG: long-chain fatty acid--CoA ligase [Candidatus Limnocylindria bacterium]